MDWVITTCPNCHRYGAVLCMDVLDCANCTARAKKGKAKGTTPLELTDRALLVSEFMQALRSSTHLVKPKARTTK